MYDNFLNILHEAFNNLIAFKNKIEHIIPGMIKDLLMSKIEKPKLIKNIAMILTMKITKSPIIILKKNFISLINCYIIRIKFQLN